MYLLLLLLVCVLVAPATASAQARVFQPTRNGLWAEAGLGYGAVECGCGGWLGGKTGQLVLGGALSQKYLLGGGTSFWTRTEGSVTLTTVTLDLRLRYYPAAAEGVFLTVGAGPGFFRLSRPGSSTTITGISLLAGMGYDVRLAPHVNLTPFISSFLVRTYDPSATVVQGGLSLTLTR